MGEPRNTFNSREERLPKGRDWQSDIIPSDLNTQITMYKIGLHTSQYICVTFILKHIIQYNLQIQCSHCKIWSFITNNFHYFSHSRVVTYYYK
jgi:hypothetical protein